MKKQKLEDQIEKLEQSNNECRQQILESEDDKVKQARIENLTEFIKMKAFDPWARIPEALISAFVDRIVVNVKPCAYHYNTNSVIIEKTEKTNEFFRVMKGDGYNGSDHR